MVFRYHTEPVSLPILALSIGLVLLGWLWGSVVGVAFMGSGLGVLFWALLQILRGACAIRLYAEYLLVQGSVSGRVRRIPYAQMCGFAITRRGGLALLYREPPSLPQRMPTEVLTAAPPAEQPPRQRFLLTARLAQPEALRAALAERLPKPPSVPERYVLDLARRRRLRDGLIVLFAVLATPFYVLIISRLLSSVC